MKPIDKNTLAVWLDLEIDAAATPEQRAELEENLAANAALRRERRSLERLHQGLAESRIEVRADFRERVLAELPVAPWEATRQSWRLPLAVMLALALGAVLLLGGSGALANAPRPIGTAIALFDFMASAALAGSGLLAASWRGLGLGLEELFARSPLNLVALGVAVTFLNLLFFRMLRRRPSKVEDPHRSPERGG